MRPDERDLLLSIAAGGSPRTIALNMGMSPNRARYLLERKWPRKDWYEYGIVYDLGWLTPEGQKKVIELAGND